MSEKAHMWSYWRGKYGVRVALEDYYPKTVAASLELQTALTQIKMAERVIEAIMKELEHGEDDEDEYG